MIAVMKEEWRDVEGHPGYRVSNLGRVMSYKQSKAGKLVKQTVKKDHRRGKPEYLRVSLADASGVRKNKRVHRLVLIAFVGPAPSEKHVGAHIDGNTRNNWLLNLKWATQIENEADKELHGTKLIGTDVANAKLNPAAVRRIRRSNTSDSAVMKKLMADLGVSRSAITDVLKGRTWSQVK
ncbi:MAG: NUMOD4 domain-containing protein [Pseudomonas sp.]